MRTIESTNPVVIIPTLSRVHQQVTLRSLPPRWRERTWLCVPASEAAQHRFPRLLVHDDLHGPARTRQFVQEAVDAPVLFQLDDDLRFYVRRTYQPEPRLRDATPEDVGACLDELASHLLYDSAVGLVAISQRQGNCWTREALSDTAGRPCRAWGYRPDVVRNVGFRFDAAELFTEDFHLALSVLRAGLLVRTTFHYAQGQSESNAPGGCSLLRTPETHDAAVRRLAELHPRYVRIGSRTTRGGWFGGDGTRTEAEIAWAKAGAEGRSGLRELPLFAA